MNDAYVRGEKDMWKENVRTNYDEIKQMVSEDKIIVAILNDDFVEPIGSVMCDSNFDKEKHLADLGMLCVKEDQTGKGIGKLLILESEKRAKEMGCSTMRLEILSPRDWKHPTKTWLDVWYT